MNCPNEQTLHRLHDRELPAAEANTLQAHVGKCERCEQALATYAAISEAVRGAPLPLPPAKVMGRWMRSPKLRRDESIRKMAGWLTTAAAAAILIAVINRQPADRPEGPALAVSPWEAAMLTAGDTEANSVQVAAANWMAADLSAGGRDEAWH
jgi:anti-sigma factor RsiW